MPDINNIRAEFNTDFANDERNGVPTIAFDLDGSSSLEWLDEDDTLCAAHESNLHNYLDAEVANEVRERLHKWLSERATVSVAVNGVEDFFVIEVSADADEDAIREAIEAENIEVGGSDAEPIFIEADSDILHFIGNAVRVYRNGVEISGLRSEEAPRRRA